MVTRNDGFQPSNSIDGWKPSLLDPMKDFREMKRGGEKITALTAYDYPTARLLDESEIDIILVGDSVGMVVLGYEDTTHVTLEEMLHHTRAVARGVKRALLVVDLPIGTYDTPTQAVATAKRLVDVGAEGVKLEGGSSHIAQIEAITAAGIPFMAHIGMLPQSVRDEGGYKIKGRTQVEAEALIADAKAVEQAGAFSVVLEIVVADLAKRITNAIEIPTIGIGSGEHCDGQILVTHDLIGLFPWFTPKFVSPEARVADEIRNAARAFIERTRNGSVLSNRSTLQ
jgi:3-methyl-2-oxobutanoate hydroxymethyltransferase